MIESLILEATYFDKCSIKRIEKIKNPNTGATELVNKTVYININCAVARGGQALNTSNNIATSINSYKLYCNPSFIIEVGDTIIVTFENGLEATFEASKPIFYVSHLESNLTEKARA